MEETDPAVSTEQLIKLVSPKENLELIKIVWLFYQKNSKKVE